MILLGDPASGKATQAARLVRRYGFYDLDMGRVLRRPPVKKTYDYKKTTARGKLTPTGVYRPILRKLIMSVQKSKGILFDGHPKMIGEARFLARLLEKIGRSDPLVVYLSILVKETVRRVRRGRRYGRKKFVKRDDDSLPALLNRARYYRTQIGQVVAFFARRYAFKKISGVGTRGEIFKRIVRFVEANAGSDT